MAKEYIEREAVLKEQKTFTEYDEGGWDAAVRAVPVEAIKNIPAADVVEVKHGRWKEVHRTPFGSSCYQCSVCEGYMPYYNGYKYCPNCGAKMDGGNDHD